MAILKAVFNILIKSIIRALLFEVMYCFILPEYLGEGYSIIREPPDLFAKDVVNYFNCFFVLYIPICVLLYKLEKTKIKFIYRILFLLIYFLFIFYVLVVIGLGSFDRIPPQLPKPENEYNQYSMFVAIVYIELIIELVKKTIKHK